MPDSRNDIVLEEGECHPAIHPLWGRDWHLYVIHL